MRLHSRIVITSAPSVSLAPGTRIGDCEIVDPLGSGAMGEVYRARDVRLNRAVAIKLMAPGRPVTRDQSVRFQQEAQTLAALNHPGIAQLYGVIDTESGLALIMELVEGPTLADVVKKGPLPEALVLEFGEQLTAALSYAHGANVIHRDLKPANIKLRPDSTIKILDFGLAKRRPEAADDRELTRTGFASLPGTIIGTPAYMAPEVLREGTADVRSDVFAVGVILFELLTGRNPFRRTSVFETAEAILSPAPVAWPSTPGVSASVKDVVARAMAKNAALRFQTATELRDSLRSLQVALPPISRRRLPVAGAAIAFVAVAAILIAGWYALERQRSGEPHFEPVDTQVTFVGDVSGVALSPDGRTAAYSNGTSGKVFARDIAGGQAVEIWSGTLVIEVQWMRDGSSVVVSGLRDDSLGIWLVPRFGGAARRLGGRGAHLAVSPDGASLATAMQNSQGFRVGALAESGRLIAMDGFRWLLGLDWDLRTNRLAALTQDDDGTRTVWTIAPDGSAKRRLISAKHLASLRWVDGTVYAIRANNELADVIRVEDREGAELSVVMRGLPWDASDPYREQGSLSINNGRMLVIRSHASANLWALPTNGRPPSPVTRGTSRFGPPRVSPDGAWIVSALGTPVRSAIVRMPVGGGEPLPISPGTARDVSPVWSPDGARVAYASTVGDRRSAWTVRVDGTEAAEVSRSNVDSAADSGLEWLPDGRLMWPVPGGDNYAIRDLATGKDEWLLPTGVAAGANGWPSGVRGSTLGEFGYWWNSPVGNSTDGLWLMRWPSREARQLHTGDYYPAGWSRDGRALFAYKYLGREILRFSGEASTPIGSFPVGALDGCDVTPDASSVICSLRETNSDAWIVDHVVRRARP